ncbi:hypothetical protein [Kitasatospora sp. CB01950]|uniref:hypothetical protein n=1 Tax=Kitasatospora sp. CB01950 TaxID=1703930 RepID=UPI00093E642D|nr:hypothetical protein [Kitasatospora sp. CB01950]
MAAVHDAVVEAREATGRRPLLLGRSLGGHVSLAHTARHPDDVAALVLHGCTAARPARTARCPRRTPASPSSNPPSTPATPRTPPATPPT